jgi:hypothetical protein
VNNAIKRVKHEGQLKMAASMISKAEIDYIISGTERNIRGDSRKRTEYRPFLVETGVVSQASGSCRLRLDGTDILVGIKVEVGSIIPERAEEEEEEPADEEGADNEEGAGRFARETNMEPDDALGGLTENRGRVVCSVEWCVDINGEESGHLGLMKATFPVLLELRASLPVQKEARMPLLFTRRL